VFQAWSAEKATKALIKNLRKVAIRMDSQAEIELFNGFLLLEQLPNWSSARDVFEVVKPKLTMAATSSLRKKFREARISNNGAVEGIDRSLEYTAADIQYVMTSICAERRKLTPNSTTLNAAVAVKDTDYVHEMDAQGSNPAVNSMRINYQINEVKNTDAADEDSSEFQPEDEAEVKWTRLTGQERETEEVRISTREKEAIDELDRVSICALRFLHQKKYSQ
jgi:hypothetical protein